MFFLRLTLIRESVFVVSRQGWPWRRPCLRERNILHQIWGGDGLVRSQLNSRNQDASLGFNFLTWMLQARDAEEDPNHPPEAFLYIHSYKPIKNCIYSPTNSRIFCESLLFFFHFNLFCYSELLDFWSSITFLWDIRTMLQMEYELFTGN